MLAHQVVEQEDFMRIAILGTGEMARTHVEAFQSLDGVEVVAGVDRNVARLEAFCTKYGIEHQFDSLEAALEWGAFDAMSNVTPDPVHKATTLQILASGKHVLCEKPLATSEADAWEMVAAAKDAGVVNMVNLTYRDVPALIEAARLVADGAIGEVRHLEASYLQSWLTQPLWGEWGTEDTWLWRLSSAHGSLGVLGDVGVHLIDFASLGAGSNVAQISANLTTFDKAEGGRIGDYVLDANDSATMQIVLENGATGVLHASRFASGHINDLRLRIYGTKGGLDVKFFNFVSELYGCFGGDMQTGKWTELTAPRVKPNFERFVMACRENSQVMPDFERGARLQAVLDRAVESNSDSSKMLMV